MTKLETTQAIALRRLTESPEWKILADLYLAMRERWKSQLIQFGGGTMEQIALERVRMAGRLEGTELLFQEIQNKMKELEAK